MPNQNPELTALVASFTASLESAIRAEASARWGAVWDDLTAHVTGSPQTRAVPAKARVRKATKVASRVVVKTKPARTSTTRAPAKAKPQTAPAPIAAAAPVAPTAPATPAAKAPAKSAKPAPPKVAAPEIKVASSPAPANLCHYPSCPNRNSGPRYFLFCKEHFAVLTPADRVKYKELWRAQHALAS